MRPTGSLDHLESHVTAPCTSDLLAWSARSVPAADGVEHDLHTSINLPLVVGVSREARDWTIMGI